MDQRARAMAGNGRGNQMIIMQIGYCPEEHMVLLTPEEAESSNPYRFCSDCGELVYISSTPEELPIEDAMSHLRG